MAGLGFKDFQVGEVLTSADVDGYLMQQTVMRFADSAARGSALGTAVGTGVPLAEGMVTYLNDVNEIQVFDGTLWRPAETTVQVVSVVKTDTFTTTSSSYVTVTDLTLTITPRSTSSKFFILASVPSSHTGSNSGKISLFRDGTNLANPATPGNRIPVMQTTYATNFAEMTPATILYIDAPATSSAVTYDIRARSDGDNMYVNRSRQDDNTTAYSRAVSTLTVVELAA